MALIPHINKTFRNAFEQKCFQLIVEAYQTSLIERLIKSDWNENDISELLCNYINNNPNAIKKRIVCKTENKLFQNAVNLNKGYADKLPRIDFIYSKVWMQQKFNYYMEAKNLKENDQKLKKRYIHTGINNFISKKYANGSLIGYLLLGNIDKTIIGINYLLENDHRDAEILTSKPNKLHHNFYESEHTEIGVLKHLIFDFTSIFK